MQHTAERSLGQLAPRVGRQVVVLLALCSVGVACKPRHKKVQAPPVVQADTATVEAAPVPPPPQPVPEAAAPAIEIRTACDQPQLNENGTGAVRIGDMRDSVRQRCMVTSDSTAAGVDGSIQGRMTVGINGATMTLQIANDRVNGLFFTDPMFQTADGFGPGSPVAPLLQLDGALVLEGVSDLSIVVGAHCGLFFQIPKPATLPPDGSRWRDVVAAMPQGTKVERVVVRGCR